MKRSYWLIVLASILIAPRESQAQYSYSGQFGLPEVGAGNGYGIAIDANQNFFISGGPNNNNIYKYSNSGTYQFTTGGSSQLSDFAPGVATNSNGNVYVADFDGGNVKVFNGSTGAYSSTFGTTGSGTGQLLHPYSIATDANGNVYVGDYGNHVVQKYDASGSFVGSIGGGTGLVPFGLATDAAENLYVSNYGANRVEKYGPGGSLEYLVGNGGQLSGPIGLALDSNGNIFVADSNNDRIMEFAADGNYIGQFGSAGSGDGQLAFPIGLAIDSNDNVYVLDQGNARVEEFSLSAVPEPSSFILCGLLASGGLGGYLWRRGRQRKIVGPATA